MFQDLKEEDESMSFSLTNMTENKDMASDIGLNKESIRDRFNRLKSNRKNGC